MADLTTEILDALKVVNDRLTARIDRLEARQTRDLIADALRVAVNPEFSKMQARLANLEEAVARLREPKP